jgi:hypothetical protein
MNVKVLKSEGLSYGAISFLLRSCKKDSNGNLIREVRENQGDSILFKYLVSNNDFDYAEEFLREDSELGTVKVLVAGRLSFSKVSSSF